MSTIEAEIAVMDQYVDSGRKHVGKAQGYEPETALAHVDLPPGSAQPSVAEIAATRSLPRAPVVSTVRLSVQPVMGLLTLRAASAHSELSEALSSTLQLSLPEKLRSEESVSGKYCIRWMSPNEWLLSCPLKDAFDIENRLRAATAGHIACVNVSGGYGMLMLSGENALSVLKKSTAYDVNPDHFNANKVVNTVLAKAQVTLRALEDDHYEIMVRRSFADYVWLWLQRAGKEYGLEAVSLS